MSSTRLIIGAIGLTFHVTTWGCDCTSMLDAAGADLVFEGVASSSIRWKATQKGSEELVRHRFTTRKMIKGIAREEFLIDSGLSDCGIPFVKTGRSYIVYAVKSRAPASEWSVSACSLTKEMKPASGSSSQRQEKPTN